MKPRTSPPIFGTPPRPAPPAPDAFALAGARLNAQRPLRDPRLQQIAAQLQANQAGLAEAALAEHLKQRPDDADALNLMARAAVRLGRSAEAISLLARCLAQAPGFSIARYNLANLLLQQHRYDEALVELDHLLAHDAHNPLFRQMKASIEETTGDAPQAVTTHRQLAAENPQRAECWLNLGHALRATGARKDCIAAYRRAIACRPSYGLAWWGLANLRTVPFDEADARTMQAQLGRSDITPIDRASLHYALGKAHEDQGAHERAFKAYEQGNTLMRERIRYDPETPSRSVARHQATFTASFFEARRGAGCPTREPIFVLGRPRSGSTLVEQILASHPAIEATAELPYIADLAAQLLPHKDVAFGAAYLEALEELPPAELATLGEAYLRRAQRHRRLGRPFFIDKMPANFFHVGLIQTILPNAKIIDVRRHPAACCWSIFKSFSSKGSLTLPELGRFHRDYVALMAHFDQTRPGSIYRVTYESLVDQPEAEIGKLLDHLGLPFEERCLRFHETQRTVLTPSSEQVRQPLFKSGIDQWRNFEAWLGPLA